MHAKNVAKNSFFSVFSQFLIIIAGFFSQRVINVRIGTELIGLNGVISNVILVFAVSELGISTAIVFHLYQALGAGDEKRIASLMNLYRRAYELVAFVMTVLGLLFLPFIHLLMRENHFTVGYIRLVYGLWLLRTVLGYLLSYKRSLIIADQREYVSSLATMAVSIFNYVSIIVFVELTGSYVLALSLGIAFEVMVNIGLICYVNRTYPFLRSYGNCLPEREVRGRIYGDVRNLFVTRIAQKLLGSTDNLIMSGFINLITVGYYSNYCLITQSLINVMQALSNALQPTIGNLMTEGDRERDEKLLRSITFVFFLLSSVIMSGVFGMASFFVSDLWLGEAFVLPAETVFLCAVNCMLNIMIMPIGVFINVSGNFRQEKWVSMSAAAVNLILSVALVGKLGVNGVLIGTTCACLILFFGKAYFYHRRSLQKKMWGYALQVSLYLVLVVAEACLSRRAAGWIYEGKGLGFFLPAAGVCVAIPLSCNLLLFCKSGMFRAMVSLLHDYRIMSRRGNGEGQEGKC